MNTLSRLAFATLLCSATGNALAASSTDLTVKGLITPSACTPTLSNAGAVDFGKLSAKDLNPDEVTWLPEQFLTLAVTCEGPTLMALEPKDNRDGTALDNSDLEKFGLGLNNGVEKIGDMELRPMSPLADGAAVRSIQSGDRGATWLIWNNFNRGYLYSVSADTNPVPLALKDYSADLRLRTRIAPASQLTLSNEVNLDGSVTLQLIYL